MYDYAEASKELETKNEGLLLASVELWLAQFKQ
jgi:hypothetical protein